MTEKLTLELKYEAADLAKACRRHHDLIGLPGVHAACPAAFFYCPFREKECRKVTAQDWEMLIRTEPEE